VVNSFFSNAAFSSSSCFRRSLLPNGFILFLLVISLLTGPILFARSNSFLIGFYYASSVFKDANALWYGLSDNSSEFALYI
jgi:hypothetical protein